MVQDAGSAPESVDVPEPGSGSPSPRSARVRGRLGPFGRLGDVKLRVNVDLGRTHLTIRDILDLRRGSVVALDKLSGESVDICVDNEKLATGEVIVIQDKLRVRVIDVIFPPGYQPEETEGA